MTLAIRIGRVLRQAQDNHIDPFTALLNLLPDTEIVVLRATRVVGAYEEAWDLLRAENRDSLTGGHMPRNVMFVTGPSRSADIEQTLELGEIGRASCRERV